MSRYDAWKTGQIGDDGSHPNSPNYNPPASVLDCPNETGTFLADHLESMVTSNAIEILGDYMTSLRDNYALAKMARQMAELAGKCTAEIERSEEQDRRRAA